MNLIKNSLKLIFFESRLLFKENNLKNYIKQKVVQVKRVFVREAVTLLYVQILLTSEETVSAIILIEVLKVTFDVVTRP